MIPCACRHNQYHNNIGMVPDGNCEHGTVANKGDACCPGLLKHPNLFQIPKSEVTAADAIALREQLLDDLGINSNGTEADKLLRCSLLETEMVMKKVNPITAAKSHKKAAEPIEN